MRIADLLLTPHADASDWQPASSRPPREGMTCRAYADAAERNFDLQLDKESKGAR